METPPFKAERGHTTVTVTTIISNQGAYLSTSPYKSQNVYEMLYVRSSSYNVYFVDSGTYIKIPYQIIRSY
ncbi:MAG: hypothetical protein ACP5GU_09415 [Thermoprotei archaeon]